MDDGAIYKNEKAELGSKQGRKEFLFLSQLCETSTQKCHVGRRLATPGRCVGWRDLFARHRHTDGLDEVTQLEKSRKMVINKGLGSAPFREGEKEQRRMRKRQ